MSKSDVQYSASQEYQLYHQAVHRLTADYESKVKQDIPGPQLREVELHCRAYFFPALNVPTRAPFYGNCILSAFKIITLLGEGSVCCCVCLGDSHGESVSSFFHVVPGDQIPFVRLGSRHRCSLVHLASIEIIF